MPIEPMGPVVVGVDGSASSLAALDLAADEAAGRVTPLVVVHVYAVSPRPVPACAPEWVDPVDARRRLLATAVGRVGAEHPCLAVEGDLVSGDPAEALVAWSQAASLVVVGADRGEGAPVAVRVATRAAAPVLVYRPFAARAAVAPRPVVVAVDGPADSDGLGGSEDLAEFAFTEAALRGAPLVALHVAPESPAPDEADRVLTEALARWSDKYPEVVLRRQVRREPDVAGALRAASAAAQLLVVGRSRHDGPARLLLGSVSQALVEQAGCPVVVIP